MKEQHTSVKYTRSEIETLPDETDWERVDVLTDEDIEEAASSDPDDPPTDASFWKDATVVMPENKVGKEQPMPQINIDSDLLVAQRLSDGCGYTWTLASRLGEMLHMAEELFGPRDCSYTILGIEFASDGPQIWYPRNHRHIIIQLDLSAATNILQACYQMAHETVHLLAPSCGRNANNFEEGVACYFAAYYMKYKFNQPNWSPTLPSYRRALEIIAPRLNEDIGCIRRLRKNQPSFRKMSKEAVSSEFPQLTSEDVDFLMSTFDRDSSKC